MTQNRRFRRPDRPSGSSLLLFGREWLRSPLGVGAVAPSSRALGRAITQGLSAESGPVVELGPGTGVFTRALLERGIPAARIAAIEASEGFAQALSRALPEVTVIAGDAARVRHLSPFGAGGAGVVVCGLPLLSMPPGKVLRILAGSFASLRPGGAFRLFTYGLSCPVPGATLGRLGLSAQRAATIPLNMPPASVYVLRRRGEAG
jgi:phospholipid N-methyltransferase